MTEEEALKLLGLRSGASSQEIKKAYRHLAKKVHSDHGGTDALFQHITDAYDILNGRLKARSYRPSKPNASKAQDNDAERTREEAERREKSRLEQWNTHASDRRQIKELEREYLFNRTMFVTSKIIRALMYVIIFTLTFTVFSTLGVGILLPYAETGASVHGLLSVLIFVVGGVLGIVACWWRRSNLSASEYELNMKRFESVRAELEADYAKLVNKYGPPPKGLKLEALR